MCQKTGEAKGYEDDGPHNLVLANAFSLSKDLAEDERIREL